MDQRDRDILRRNRVFLVANLDLTIFMSYLIQEEIITDRMYDGIRKKGDNTREGHVENFLQVLPTRGPDAMDVFLAAIKVDYKFVWERLTANRHPTGAKGWDIDVRIKPCLKWSSKVGELEMARHVTWTPAGGIVVTDMEARKVVLFNEHGQVVTSTQVTGVEFEDEPWGVTCDLGGDEVIVSDDAGYLTWLGAADLTLRRRVKLEGDGDARGVGVLKDGSIVVGREVDESDTVGVYERYRGRRLRHTQYCYGASWEEVNTPWFITVLPDDTIAVAMNWSNQIVYLSPVDLQCRQVVEVRRPGGLTLAPHGAILAPDQHSSSIHHLQGSVGQVHSNQVWSPERVEGCDLLQSLSMSGHHLAVLFLKTVQLYHWPQ